MAKKVGGGGAIMQPYDENGEYDFNEEGVEPERVVKGKPPSDKSIDELKKEISQTEKPTENTIVNAQREVDKKTITDSNAFKTIISGRDKIEKDLERLSDEQLGIVSKYIKDLRRFENGSGEYGSKTISYNQNGKGDRLDKELGFDFDANTFYHEFGHFVDNMSSGDNPDYNAIQKANPNAGMWNIVRDSNYTSVTVDVTEDATNCFNETMKIGGGKEPLKNLNRIKSEQKSAFYRGLAKLTGKDQLMPEKKLTDFGYIREPIKPTYTPEQAKAWFGEQSYNMTLNRWANYKQEYAEWEEANAPGGINDKARKELEAYDKKKDEHDKPFKVKMQRYGFISDFFGIYTKGRFSPHSAGYWGHSDSYGKSTLVQVETWAEYFSFKMTNDDIGLGMMKKYLPNTYKAFEEKYNKLKER